MVGPLWSSATQRSIGAPSFGGVEFGGRAACRRTSLQPVAGLFSAVSCPCFRALFAVCYEGTTDAPPRPPCGVPWPRRGWARRGLMQAAEGGSRGFCCRMVRLTWLHRRRDTSTGSASADEHVCWGVLMTQRRAHALVAGFVHVLSYVVAVLKPCRGCVCGVTFFSRSVLLQHVHGRGISLGSRLPAEEEL